MFPWAPPAKNARIERLLGARPRLRGGLSLEGSKLYSGNETSLLGWNPSEVLALHSTLMKFLKSLGSSFDTSGPWNIKKKMRY